MEITLGQLCKQRQVKQAFLAAQGGVDRSVICKDLNGNDMRVSRLRSIIEALDGKLVLRGNFQEPHTELC